MSILVIKLMELNNIYFKIGLLVFNLYSKLTSYSIDEYFYSVAYVLSVRRVICLKTLVAITSFIAVTLTVTITF